MKFNVEFPDTSFKELSYTIIFPNCNMSCEYCNYKKMIEMKSTTEYEEFYSVMNSMVTNKSFYETVVFTGGEPSLYKKELMKGLMVAKSLGKKTIVYTNLLELDLEYLKFIDKVVVDVKGFDVNEISASCDITLNKAETLLLRYDKFKDDDRFLFRINNNEQKHQNIKFKNVEYFELEMI